MACADDDGDADASGGFSDAAMRVARTPILMSRTRLAMIDDKEQY